MKKESTIISGEQNRALKMNTSIAVTIPLRISNAIEDNGKLCNRLKDITPIMLKVKKAPSQAVTCRIDKSAYSVEDKTFPPKTPASIISKAGIEKAFSMKKRSKRLLLVELAMLKHAADLKQHAVLYDNACGLPYGDRLDQARRAIDVI